MKIDDLDPALVAQLEAAVIPVSAWDLGDAETVELKNDLGIESVPGHWTVRTFLERYREVSTNHPKVLSLAIRADCVVREAIREVVNQFPAELKERLHQAYLKEQETLKKMFPNETIESDVSTAVILSPMIVDRYLNGR